MKGPGRVACVGIATWDLILAVPDLPTAAGKHRASARMEIGGGVAANAAVTVARLGGRAALATRIGDDETGRRIIAGLEAEDVVVTASAPEGMASPLSVVLVDRAGERLIVNHAGADLFSGPPIPTVPEADAVLADMRWDAAAMAFLGEARRRGVPAILDCDHDPTGREALLDTADTIIFALPTLLAYTGAGNVAEALAVAARRHGSWVAATAGADGVWWIEDGELAHLAAPRVDAVDTLGAGDVFHGAFALAVAEGEDRHAALRFANAAAALKCTRFGGRSGIPYRHEVERFMEVTT